MTAIARKLITAEEFFLMPDHDRRTELVDGEVVEMSPPGGEHGQVGSEFLVRMHPFARQHRLGVVVGEVGFKLKSDPDTVRGPDIAFLEAGRVPEGKLPRAFVDGPPTIAVEVISPSNRREEVQAKVAEYLAAGARRVWVANPRQRSVTVHYPDGTTRTLHDDDMLSGEDVLPGFEAFVRDLFP